MPLQPSSFFVTLQPNREDMEQTISTLTLPNDISTIPQLAEFVETIAERMALDMSMTMSLNLALEEAVVNVMNYAYPEGTQGDIRIDALNDGQWLHFIITDSGKPFDPTAKEEVDITQTAEERSIGGLGIHLVRQIMDKVGYRRHEGQNILTLSKHLTNT